MVILKGDEKIDSPFTEWTDHVRGMNVRMKRKINSYNFNIGLTLTVIMVSLILLGFFWTPYDPVSYTHLDVYKRQVLAVGPRSKV